MLGCDVMASLTNGPSSQAESQLLDTMLELASTYPSRVGTIPDGLVMD